MHYDHTYLVLKHRESDKYLVEVRIPSRIVRWSDHPHTALHFLPHQEAHDYVERFALHNTVEITPIHVRWTVWDVL